MKKIRVVVFFAFVCVLIVASAAPWLAAENTPGKNEKNLQPTLAYTARIHQTEISGGVGEPIQIPLDLSPYPSPVGVFYSFVGDVLEKPQGDTPKVLPRDRETSVLCSTSGTYRLRIRVNLIGK